MTPRVEPVTPANVVAACKLAVRPEQSDVVATVAVSLAQAYTMPEVAWPRVLYDGDRMVGFVMGAFDPLGPIDYFRCGIWRLLIDADAQRGGYGRFAVRAVCDEARRRGQDRVTVLWVPHPFGPENFYRRLGFTPTGQIHDGQVVAELSL